MIDQYWPSVGAYGEVSLLLFRIILGSSVIALSGRVALWGIAQVSSTPNFLPSNIQRFQISELELQAILQLVIIAAIALPILPNQSIGPWNAVNPRTVGYLVLFIAGISVAGHMAMRILGHRAGLFATSAIGGLVSSTAVTLSFAKRARQEPHNVVILGAGISLAASIMAMRVLVEVSLINAQLLPALLPSMTCLFVVPLIAAIAIVFYAPNPQEDTPPASKDPIELGSAIFFGLVLAILSILVHATEEWFGETGVYLLSAISGITDVDALSLSLSEATQHSLSLKVAALGIFTGVAVNTVVKGLMASVIGGASLAQWCGSIFLVALGFGAIAMVLT